MFDENDIVRTTTVLTLLLTPGLLLYRMDIGLGVLLGGLMSVLALRLMVVDATRLLRMAKTVSLSSRDVSRLNRRSFLKRLALYAATFAAAAVNPHVNYLAAFGGLLLPRLAIYYHLLQGRIKRGS
ncbi:MAG: twin-arginine translocation signal domain-containing protein [Firmicutes bacterium]|nr:twin-arginine translocation signal domain-containing protein [Bacillota bacterium]